MSKFKNLQYAGYKASLTLEAEHGEAYVTLKASLGCLPPPEYIPPVHPGYGLHVPSVKRSPAYNRRQERRKVARLAAGNQDTQAEKVREEITEEISEVTQVAVKATEQVREEVTEEISEGRQVAEKAADTNAEKSPESFECYICDFKSNWENGLQVHMSRIHNRIEQLDGNADDNLEGDENYEGSKHYWMKGWLGGAFQSFIDANKVLEDCDLSEDDKNTERAKLLDARKSALGDSFRYFPPWDRS